MTQAPGPSEQTKLADDYASALELLERRSRRNIVAVLRRSLNGVLVDLRRSYSRYLDELGPQAYDPQRQTIRRPGEYSAAEATAKFRSIVLDAQRFMGEEELRQWTISYERDLREAARLGGELGVRLEAMVRRPEAEMPFTGADPLAIRAAAQSTSAYIQNETVRFRDQLVAIVGEGATRGWGPTRLEKQIRQALRGSKDPNGITQRLGLEQRAALIARSELANAYAKGSLARARERGDAYVRVLASNDERTCPTCASRNGRIYPVDRVVLPWHPRCVLGDTHVSPGLLAAVFRSVYRGHVVAIRLANGERFQVTIDHPVLTPAGWVKAETLRKGDQLLGHGLNLSAPAGAEAPDLHQVPATAEEVFAAFAEACAVPAMAVPVTALDLHGDGQFIEGDVEVVRANGLLQGHWVTEPIDGLGNGDGVRRRMRFGPFLTLSHADAALLWHAAAAGGSVSRLREALALLRGGLSHAEEHRIAAAAWADPALAQEGNDRVALHAQLRGYGLDAGAGQEQLNGPVFVKNRAVAGEGDAKLGKAPVDDIAGDAKDLGDLLGVMPGLVELHQVVDVEINPFHGFVYTFETFCGAYSVGRNVRVTNRNCRCVAVPAPNEAVQEKDPATRALLLDSERWREEHEAGVRAYAEAQHRKELDGLQRQRDRVKDPEGIESFDERIRRLEDRGPDMKKAQADLARALRTPTASEKRLYPRNPLPLVESVPLFD
jgi:SPP1 gp7 family putative phage head morphogenesis protein